MNNHADAVVRYLLAQEIQAKRRKENLPWIKSRVAYPESNSYAENNWTGYWELLRATV
ncbi:hypothetical protein [Pseudomonas phage PJNP053]|uniref:Uncharacterized protein n=1 Tax=Pseudomonas phage vB_Pae_AM.P2 TaxID=2731695 RepID=A0A7S6B6B5_9CAUD|nr:hypothetical protein AMP2_gp041 [Pseudomonas phage vB_Pae_AM.P2]